ncbi:MAG: beta-galactosidase [Thermoprotei archaeon]|nr:beta-galactosidase [Thermoprotei archaeon]
MSLQVKEGYVIVNGKRIPLLSGEFHYWRVPKENWRKVLMRIKELGLDLVSSYVPWNYHEVSKGKYDFKGETSPQRDLDGFLSLTEELGFLVLIRPGPYIYSEWPNAGPPDYAVRYHRLHDEFFKSAEPYIRAVSEIISPHQHTRGGNVVLLQVDNEIDPWTPRYGRQLGLRGEPGLFHEWLKEKYESVENLNRAWGTRYRKITEARPLEIPPPSRKFPELRRYLDFCEFREWCVVQIAKRLTKMFRDYGIEIPVYFNTYPTLGTPQNFIKLKEMADLIGIDIYMPNMVPWDSLLHLSAIVRYMRASIGFAWSAEFGSGIWHDWHYKTGVIGPGHHRYMALLAMMFGLVGWNWYMLVNRDNWYFSPINEWGRARWELWDDFKYVIEVYKEVMPVNLEKLTETTLVLPRSLAYNLRDDLWNATFSSLHKAGIDFELYVPESGRYAKKLIIYSGPEFLKESQQELLMKEVKKGATLVFMNYAPKLSDEGGSTEVFKGYVPEVAGVYSVPGRYEVKLSGKSDIITSEYVVAYEEVGGEPIIAERYELRRGREEEDIIDVEVVKGERYVIGYVTKCGNGRIVTIGLTPSPKLLIFLHDALNVPLYVRPEVSNILAALYRDDGSYYLFVANVSNEEKGAIIHLDTDSLGISGNVVRVEEVRGGEVLKGSPEILRRLTFWIPAKSIKVFRITPSG